MSEQTTEKRGTRKTRTGIVTSNKMQKSIVVQVSRRTRHGAYGKYLTHTKTYMVHDENNDAAPGDHVVIEETRPLSKNKRWKLKSIVSKAVAAPAVGDETAAG
jgi:small subunit ribosomal protein S17